VRLRTERTLDRLVLLVRLVVLWSGFPGQPCQTLTTLLLLGALPEADFERLVANLDLISMPLGDVLYESGGQLAHVYFPTTSIVSLLYVMEDGASAEIAVVGNEGMLGIALFMGGETTPSRAIVQSGARRRHGSRPETATCRHH
jgi:hypothetical protein